MRDKMLQIVSSIFILMFLLSGIVKFFSLGNSESSRLKSKLSKFPIDIPMFSNHIFNQVIVFLAGLFEIVSVCILLYGIWNFNKEFIYIGSIMLIGFTAFATLIFYVFPFKDKPFMSNLSILTGLILLMHVCYKDSVY